MRKIMERASVVAAAFFVSSALMPVGVARADSQIYACVNNASGETKMVAQNATCKNNESLVVWNVVGPQGPIGPQGPAGPAGPTGPAGPAGPIGLTGATGPVGPQGPIGLTGAIGPVGPAGPIGLTGATGPVGPQGPIGLTGATGPVGPAGPIGLTGATGPAGPAGPIGLTGATGPVGPQGPIGLTGATGPAGPAGPIGLTGAIGPAGPAGPIGLTGTIGPVGPQGISGPAGPSGATGAIGPIGPVGPQGPPGPGVSGTTNFVPFFSSSATLGNSVIQQAQPVGWSNIAVGFNGIPGNRHQDQSPIGVDIQGTVSEGTPNGLQRNPVGRGGDSRSRAASLRPIMRGAIVATPDFNFNAGYGNYAEGAFIAAPNITAGYANVVSSLELAQPGRRPCIARPAARRSTSRCRTRAATARPAQNQGLVDLQREPVQQLLRRKRGYRTWPSQRNPIHAASGAVLDVRGCLDERLQPGASKKDIRPLPADEATETLSALLPVTFRYKADDEAHVGFIAEDVPDLVAARDRKGLSAMDIVAVLAKVVQQQQQELSDQRKELDALKAQLERGRGN